VPADRLGFDDDVASLGDRLARAAGADPRVSALIEERALGRAVTGGEADPSVRQLSVESALEQRATQLLNNPQEFHAVLERQFGDELHDDDAIRRDVRDLHERVGRNPRETAARRAAEDAGREDPDQVEELLREWIIQPAIDVVTSLDALGRMWRTYGIDLRQRLSEFQRGIVREVLTRWEESEFGEHWATIFDAIAILSNHSVLDGVFIMFQMEDVESYFTDPDVRSDIRELFRKVLGNHDEPTILVAHSFGSVIAYDVLREFPELDVSGLVTLGSPLSMDYFRDRLARPGESGDNLPVPAMLDEWVNVYSEMDPLTLGSGISQYFQGGGEVEGPGPIDLVAENTGYLDAHSPDQYLRSNETAKAVVAMIGDATVREGFAELNDEDT